MLVSCNFSRWSAEIPLPCRSMAVNVIVGTVVLSLLVGLVLGMVITRGIAGPVAKGVAFAESLADGDLAAVPDMDQKVDVGRLAKALNNMVAKLKTVVAEVQSAAVNVAANSPPRLRK